ncbi:H-type lectin domain-containing protein [Algirhabdus cladophorae]|uniref:H-type lectin domain-containing protein n=1 Tax=Algirhabdus cladophorae TaxID=3377108 RepID=UPI003B8477EC
MKRIRQHLVGITQGQVVLFSDYLDGGEMWTGEGQRVVRRRVIFDEAFAKPPSVTVSMTMWDADKDTNMRGDIAAQDVQADGFDLVFETWGDSRWARVRLGWMAIGEVIDDEGWQLY